MIRKAANLAFSYPSKSVSQDKDKWLFPSFGKNLFLSFDEKSIFHDPQLLLTVQALFLPNQVEQRVPIVEKRKLGKFKWHWQLPRAGTQGDLWEPPCWLYASAPQKVKGEASKEAALGCHTQHPHHNPSPTAPASIAQMLKHRKAGRLIQYFQLMNMIMISQQKIQIRDFLEAQNIFLLF